MNAYVLRQLACAKRLRLLDTAAGGSGTYGIYKRYQYYRYRGGGL